MIWSRLLGVLIVAAIALNVLGAIVVLATETLPSEFFVGAVGSLALVAVLVVGTTMLGRLGGGSSRTPYW